MAITEVNLEFKVVEFNEVETLDRARRRGGSKAMQIADNKVAAIKDEMNKKIGADKCEVQAASADSRTAVFPEISYTALFTSKR